MAKKKPGTFEKVARTVKKAAKVVAAKADQFVLEPVGDALGLKKKRTTRRTGAAKKSAATKRGTTNRRARTAKTARKGSR
jgi:hypothetical protein